MRTALALHAVALLARGGDRLERWICAHSGQGHAYRVTCLTTEADTFVLDPLTVCRHCAKPMDENQYDSMLRGYERMLEQGARDG